jgi:hypothetical protein
MKLVCGGGGITSASGKEGEMGRCRYALIAVELFRKIITERLVRAGVGAGKEEVVVVEVLLGITCCAVTVTGAVVATVTVVLGDGQSGECDAEAHGRANASRRSVIMVLYWPR